MDASADVIRSPEGDGTPEGVEPGSLLRARQQIEEVKAGAQRRPRAGLCGPVHRRGRNAARARPGGVPFAQESAPKKINSPSLRVGLAGANGHFVDEGECSLFSGLMCRDLRRVPRSKPN